MIDLQQQKKWSKTFNQKEKKHLGEGVKKRLLLKERGLGAQANPPPNPNFLGLKTVPPNQILKEIIRFRYRVSHET